MADSSFYNSDSAKGLTKKFKKKNVVGNGNSTGKSNKGQKKVLRGLGKGALVLIAIGAVVLVVIYFFAFRPAYSLLSNVNNIQDDVAKIKADATARDLVALGEDFDQLESDLKEFREARDSNVSWARDFPLTKDYYSDTDHFVEAGLHMVDAGREVIVLVVPFADAGGFKVSEEQEVEELALADAFSRWIGIMPQIAEDLDPVLNELTMAGEELAKVDASRYPDSIRGQPVRPVIEQAQTALVQLNDAAPDIKRALVIIPPLLGVDSAEKRYMIVMQNDKELRPTGGFWTYFSTFKLNNALLTSDFTSYGTYNIDFALEVIDPYYTFPTVPQAYKDHLKVERLYARDANISPDLPTAIDQFQLFWDLATPLAPAQFKPIDGVFTIDTVVLEELLEVTGPVTLNGVTYDEETVTLELEKIASLALKEQANRKKILGDLMEQMLVNVFESDSNLWSKLIEKGMDLATRKHIQVWVFDEEAQKLLEKYNFAGRIVDPVDGDYVFVVSDNLGGGKTNTWFVNKDVDHELSREGDRYVRTVRVKYDYGERDSSYDPFKQLYQDWVRVYTPLGSELISVEGSADPESTGEERNKTWFGGYVTVSPGESKEITFKYYLPEGVVDPENYQLYIQKQSGIDTETHNVIVGGTVTTIELVSDEEFSTAL